MNKSVFACLTGVLCLSVSCVSGNGGGSSQNDEAAVASESSVVAEEAVVKEEKKPFNLYESDFHVKYNAYSWKTASDYSTATRNEAGDATWEITKKGDTMTIVEESNDIILGRQTVTTVFKEVDGNVEKTVTTVYANEEYNRAKKLAGTDVKTSVSEGATLNGKVESWFNTKGPGQKGTFVIGSRNPERKDDNLEATVSKGDRMFGRSTMVYDYKTKKGSVVDLAGYEMAAREIYDSERSGRDYFRYKAWLILKDGVERLTFEVTEFEIL